MSGRAIPVSRAGRLAAGLAALLAVGAAFAGCAGERDPNRITFRVAPRLSSFVAYLAADAGHFAAEGLDVDLVPFDSPSTVIPSLAQGDLDVSTVWRLDPAYVNLIARGGRLRLVAAGMVLAPGECGYSAFLARPELIASGRLERPDGLRGLRVSTERTSSSYYVWSRLMEQKGLTMEDVEIVDVPSAARIEAFSKDLIDIATATEPWRTRLIRSGHAALWRPAADVLPGAQTSFIVFGRRLLEERRDLGVRFLRAYQRAVRDYVEQGRTERLIEIVARRTQMAPDELREMCWPTYTLDAELDAATVDDFQRWALAAGQIDAALPLEQLFDAHFLRAAAAAPAD